MMNMNMNMNFNGTEDITNIQVANKVIKELKNENRLLKDKLNRIEEKLNLLEQYKNQMDLNCYYNQFDINAYKLDDIFNSLDSDIIKEKEEFGLINKGIRKLFNKNIKNFELIFQKKETEFDPSTFREIFNNLTYSVIIVSTKIRNNNIKFGAFINKNLDNNNQMINQNNQMLNQNNPMINNFRRNQLMTHGNRIMAQGNRIMAKGNRIMAKGNRMINHFQNNQMINQDNAIIIFDSNLSSDNFFIFAFNSSDIYFKEDPNQLIPSFSITYNKRYNRFLGNENPIIAYPNSNNIYKLIGEKEFIVDCLELYEIRI